MTGTMKSYSAYVVEIMEDYIKIAEFTYFFRICIQFGFIIFQQRTWICIHA